MGLSQINSDRLTRTLTAGEWEDYACHELTRCGFNVTFKENIIKVPIFQSN